MRIRKAFEKDIENLLFIEKNCGYPLPQYALTKEHFIEMLKEEIVLVAENKEPIAYATVKKSFRDGSELDAIGVLKKYQNKSIGTTLLERVVKEVKKLGRKKLYSYCWQKNFPSIAFHNKIPSIAFHNKIPSIAFHNKNRFHVIELTRKRYSGGELAILFCKDL